MNDHPSEAMQFRIRCEPSGSATMYVNWAPHLEQDIPAPITAEKLAGARLRIARAYIEEAREQLPDHRIMGKAGETWDRVAFILDRRDPRGTRERLRRWFRDLMNIWLEPVFAVCLTLFSAAMLVRAVWWVGDRVPPLVHYVFLGGCIAGMLLLVSRIMSTNSREKNRNFLVTWFGNHAYLTLPSFILIIAVSVFGELAYLMARNDPGMFIEGSAAATREACMQFFIWHLLQLVPGYSVTDVLKWEEPPLSYDSTGVGVMVLLFQIAVVIPSITTIGYHWKARRAEPLWTYELDPPVTRSDAET